MIFATFGLLTVFFVTQIEESQCVRGGQVAKASQFPAQIAILVTQSNGTEFLCGGTILNENHVLTAATCVCIDKALVPREHVLIQAGSPMLSKQTTKLNVAAIFLHELFNPETFENDIAVIRMAKKFDNFATNDPNAKLKNAILQNRTVADNTQCQIAGWYPYPNAGSDKEPIPLRFLTVSIYKRDQCNSEENHSGKILETMLCAGINQQSTEPMAVCPSNRGGGLYCNELLTGILSFGLDCGRTKKPGVYTQARMYSDWIEEKFTDSSVPKPGPIQIPSVPNEETGTNAPGDDNKDDDNNDNNQTNGTQPDPHHGSAGTMSLTLSLFIPFLFLNLVISM